MINENIQILDLDVNLIESDINHNPLSSDIDEARVEIIKGIKTKRYFTGLCTKCNKDGDLTIDINGVPCRLLRNDLSVVEEGKQVHKGLCQKKVGTHLKVKVSHIENEGTDDEVVYVTRKELVREIRNYYNTNLKEHCVISGKVFHIDEKMGVFVDIGGDVIGVIPRSRLENLYVSKLTDHIEVGEKVKAVVIEIKTSDDGKISSVVLDRKSLLPKFNKLVKEFEKGDIILAKIKAITETGIYVTLGKHLDMLCDFTSEKYKPGQNVQVRVDSIKFDKKRITGTVLSKI